MPHLPSPYALLPDEKVGPGFQRILTLLSGRAHQLSQQTRADAETVHEVRTLIKRSRAMLWFARPVLTPAALQKAKSRLKEAAQLLGTRRDLEVTKSTLHRLVAEAPESTLRKNLGHAARLATRNHSRSQRQESPAASLRQAAQLLVDTLEEINRLATGIDDSQWPKSQARVRKALRSTRRAGKKARYRKSDEAFHLWRKKIKRLLYELEFTEPAPGKKKRRLIKRVDQLQDKLGTYHDYVIAQEHLRTESRTTIGPTLKHLEARKAGLRKKAARVASRIKP